MRLRHPFYRLPICVSIVRSSGSVWPHSTLVAPLRSEGGRNVYIINEPLLLLLLLAVVIFGAWLRELGPISGDWIVLSQRLTVKLEQINCRQLPIRSIDMGTAEHIETEQPSWTNNSSVPHPPYNLLGQQQSRSAEQAA